MSMKKRNLKLSTSLLFSAPTLISPIFVTSCVSDLPVGDINKEQQNELVTSEASKNTILDSWITTTFSSLYAKKILPNGSNVDQQKISNTIRYYLDYLVFPSVEKGKLLNGTSEVEFTIDEALFPIQEKNKLVSLIEEAYKFYISYHSTISTSSSNSSDSNSTASEPKIYFLNKSLEWKKNKYTTNIEIKEGTKILSINDFKPSLNYTGLDETGQIIQNDFKILWSTRGTLIYQDILKLLLAEIYFLDSSETLIKNGTNFNKLVKNPSSVDYINTYSFLEFDNANKTYDYSSYLLKKYLIERNLSFKWEYLESDYNNQISTSFVSNILQFNNIKSTKETKLNQSINIMSTESTTNSLLNLEAFTGLVKTNSSDDSSFNIGDLASDIDSIKSFGTTKAGLFDKEKNLLFTFTELEAIKKIREFNLANNNELSIPSINLKETANDKKSHSITIEDLDVSWGQTNSAPIFDEKSQSYTYTSPKAVQKIIINSISFSPSSTEKEIGIDFTYIFNDMQQDYSFNYSFTISNWGETSTAVSNPFTTPYLLSGSPEQVGIKLFSDTGSSLGIQYYLRVLPLFKKSNQLLINGKWYTTGEFSFKGTPWETREQKRILVYYILLNNSSIFTSIKDFYLFNNFNIEGHVSQLASKISELGLTAKTNEDRKKEGII